MGRYFIGTATTDYQSATGLEQLPELAAELESATDLFRDLGYEVVPGFGLNLSKSQFTSGIREFLRSPARTAADVIVVYYTGHGEVTASGDDLLLPMADATGDLAFSSQRAGDLTGRLLDSTKPGDLASQQLLFILDTCYAGAGGAMLATGAAHFVDSLRGMASVPAVAVIVSARPYQQAGVGTFTQALIRAVRERSIAGHEVPFVPLEPLVNRINAQMADASPEGVARQHARLLYVAERAGEFFPNSLYDEWFTRLDVRTRDLRIQQEARRRDRDDAALAAQGLANFVGRDDLWLFVGRNAALRKVTAWLASPEQSTMVVTGAPGSGKSALLSRLNTLADPRQRPRVPNIHLLPPDTVPPLDSIHRFIHAQGMTSLDLLAALAETCGIDDIGAIDSPGKLISRIRERTDPITVIIDEVEEAAVAAEDAGRDTSLGGRTIVDQVLAPLVQAGPRIPLRMLIGSRSHLISALGQPITVVNLDGTGYADRPGLHRYVRSCLIDLVETSPYREQRPEYLRSVVDAVAEAAGDSFLVALITARSLALRARRVSDPDEPVWRRSLPREAADAMRDDLHVRLEGEAERARDLLLPLAYAQASGLPWEDLWPRLVTRLTGRQCRNGDLDWLFENAGYYVIETRLGRNSAYRLYHAALSVHLRDGRDQQADHAAILAELVERVPRRRDGSTDWGRAHPYTVAAVSSHAAAADRLDGLISEPRLLTETESGPLLAVLPQVRTPRGRTVADAYRRAVSRMRAYPAERAAYLQLAARCARAPALADDITASGLPLPWTTHWASWRLQPPHQTLPWHRDAVTAVALGDVGGRTVMASASRDRHIRLWDASDGRPLGAPLAGHEIGVTSVAFGQVDGRAILVSGGRDGTVRRWDVAAMRQFPGAVSRHSGEVRSVAFGGVDGRPVMVSAGDDRAIRVWDAVTGRLVGRPLVGHASAVHCVAIGQVDGRSVVASGGADGTIRLWDTGSGETLHERSAGHLGRVRAMAFAQLGDDTVVVCGGDDGVVQTWSAASGELVAPPYTGHSDIVNAVAIGRRGGQTVVVSAGNDQTVQMWELATGRLVDVEFTGHTDWVLAVAFGEVNGLPVIASGGEDETVRLWDAAPGAPIGEPFTGHVGTISAVAVADLAGQPVIASAGTDQTVRLWDATSGQPISVPLIGHTDRVATVVFGTLDGQPIVASGGEDGTLRLWNPAHPDRRDDLVQCHAQVSSVAFGYVDGRSLLAIGGDDRLVHRWDVALRRWLQPVLSGHDASVNAVTFGDLDGRQVIVSGSMDHTLRRWDASSGQQIGSPLVGHTGPVRAVAFGAVHGRPAIASGGDDQTVRLWDARSGEPLIEPLAGPGIVRAITFGHLGRNPVVIAGGSEPAVQLFDVATGQAAGSLLAAADGVSSVAFGQAGRQSVIVAGGADAGLRTWDAATGNLMAAPFAGHSGPVTAVAFGRLDGALVVASGSTDHTVRLWDAGSGRPLAPPFTGHTDGVRSVAFGQLNGRDVVVSASEDKSVRLWDAATGEPVGAPFTQHRSSVSSVAVTQIDGRLTVVSGSNDHAVHGWDALTREHLWQRDEAHSGYVNAVAVIHHGGRTVAVTGGHDYRVRLWDARTGARIGRPLTGHSDSVMAVAAAAVDGKLIVVSAGNDRTVRGWDGSSCEPLGSPDTRHVGWVRTVAAGMLGERLIVVSGGTDQSLFVCRGPDGLDDDQSTEDLRIRLTATVNCVAIREGGHLVVGTDLGIVSLRLSS